MNIKYFKISIIICLLLLSARPHVLADDNSFIKDYIKEISSVMTDIDITMRNIGMGIFPMGEGVKRLDGYIFRIKAMESPEELEKEHKMVLLSFKKMRMGLLLFSEERKDLSVGLIKSGTRILKTAAQNIVKIAREKGIIEDKEEREKDKGGEK